MIVAPANAHDSTLIEGIIESVVIDRPVEVDEHLCLDKAFDSEAVRETVKDAYYTPHIRGRGEEKKACDSKAGEKPASLGGRTDNRLAEEIGVERY